MDRVTKGSIEDEIANAVVRFHREQQGRGPQDVRAHLLGELVLVHCFGIFTPTEAHLSQSEELVGKVCGCGVLRSFCDVDVDVESAEQVEVYVLSEDVGMRMLRQDLDRLGGLAGRHFG